MWREWNDGRRGSTIHWSSISSDSNIDSFTRLSCHKAISPVFWSLAFGEEIATERQALDKKRKNEEIVSMQEGENSRQTFLPVFLLWSREVARSRDELDFGVLPFRCCIKGEEISWSILPLRELKREGSGILTEEDEEMTEKKNDRMRNLLIFFDVKEFPYQAFNFWFSPFFWWQKLSAKVWYEINDKVNL